MLARQNAGAIDERRRADVRLAADADVDRLVSRKPRIWRESESLR